MKNAGKPVDTSSNRPIGAQRIRFGEFTLDLGGRCLRRDGRRLRLTPKPFETLAFLVENRHQTIDKQRILDAVWKDAAVTEGALVQAIREVRRVLGDDDKEPLYIQTIPRVGYRFVGEISLDAPAQADYESVAAASQRRGWWTWPSIVIGGGMFLAGFAALWLFYSASTGPRFAVAGAVSERPVRQLTSEPLNALKPAYSPDGKRLLYASSGRGVPGMLDLFVMPAEGGKPWQLTDGINASGDHPVFTSDGSRIVFSRFRDGKDGTRLPDLWSVASFGGAPSMLLSEASGAGFSPDGTRIAYTKHVAGQNPLWGGAVDRPETHRQIADRGFVPRWSPDGRWIAYTTSDPAGGSGYLWMVSVEPGAPVRLTAEPEDIFGLTWTPDSRAVVVSSSRTGQGAQLRMVPVAGGPAVPLTAGVGYYLSPFMSRDGTLAFTHYRPSSTLAFCARLTDADCKRISQGEFNLGHLWPRLSPSARLVASVGRLHEGGERLWITEIETGRRLRTSEQPASHPAWLDDDRVAFLSSADNGDAKTGIHVMSSATGASFKLADVDGRTTGLAAHPTRKEVAFIVRAPDGRQRIAALDLNTHVERVVAAGGEYEELRWRPDGSMLAWSGPATGGDKGSNGIWLLESGSSAPRQAVKDGYSPAWSADGRAIYFTRMRGGTADTGLWRFDISRGEATRVRSWGRVTYYDVAGDLLVFAVDDAVAQVFEMRSVQ